MHPQPPSPAGDPVSPPTPADCRACGVCCHSALEAYVRVTGDDWARLGDEAPRVAHFIGNRAYLRMVDGHCIGLRIDRAPDGRVDAFCTLYERRPQTCRDLERGSPACGGEILSKGGRVKLRVEGVEG